MATRIEQSTVECLLVSFGLCGVWRGWDGYPYPSLYDKPRLLAINHQLDARSEDGHPNGAEHLAQRQPLRTISRQPGNYRRGRRC